MEKLLFQIAVPTTHPPKAARVKTRGKDSESVGCVQSDFPGAVTYLLRAGSAIEGARLQ